MAAEQYLKRCIWNGRGSTGSRYDECAAGKEIVSMASYRRKDYRVASALSRPFRLRVEFLDWRVCGLAGRAEHAAA
ncbi:hypothetical protein CIB48_g12193 [Xylaria polymorpha]|nr:hypothetical protein CIB48_g12193 [Xylaria polymorpha]